MNEENKLNQNNISLIIIICLILVIVILLGFCGYFVFNSVSGKKINGNNEITTTTTTQEVTTTSNVDETEIINRLSKTAITKIESSLNSIFSDIQFVPGKEYLNDVDFKFAFLVYLYSWESENLENGDEGTTGLFTMDINTFKGLYLKAYGEDLDINKLNKNSEFYKGVKYPTISDSKIHSSFYTGPVPDYYVFKYESSSAENGLNLLTFSYGTLNNSNAGNEYSVVGSSYMKLSVDPKGFISYKSFISSK